MRFGGPHAPRSARPLDAHRWFTVDAVDITRFLAAYGLADASDVRQAIDEVSATRNAQLAAAPFSGRMQRQLKQAMSTTSLKPPHRTQTPVPKRPPAKPQPKKEGRVTCAALHFTCCSAPRRRHWACRDRRLQRQAVQVGRTHMRLSIGIIAAIVCVGSTVDVAEAAQMCAGRKITATGVPSNLTFLARSRAKTAWIAKVSADPRLGPTYAQWLKSQDRRTVCRKIDTQSICIAAALPCRTAGAISAPPQKPSASLRPL